MSQEDYVFLSQYRWSLNGGGYVHGWVDGRCEYMHRLVVKRMGLALPEQTDHDDRNKLNNRRSNLKPASGSQNQHNKGIQANNTSGFPGVVFCQRTGRWLASMKRYGRTINLGRFDTPEQASAVYQRAKGRNSGATPV